MIDRSKDGRLSAGFELIDIMPLYQMDSIRAEASTVYEREYAKQVMIESIKSLKETVKHFDKQLSLTK